ncbi:hypothetical protein GCM10018966_077360 [Streptomyces yanii]
MIWEQGGRARVRDMGRSGRGGALRAPVAVGALGALVLGGCAGGGGSSHPFPSASVVGRATLFPSDSGGGGGGGGGQGGGSGIGFPAVKVGESADTVVEMKNNEQRAWEHDKPSVAGDGAGEGDGVQGAKAAGTGTASEASGDGHNVYLIVEDHCGDDPIPPGRSCTFKIRFIRGSNDAPPAVLLEIDSPTWPIRTVVTAASEPGVTPNTVPSGLETSGPAVSPGTTGPTSPTGSPTGPGESPAETTGPAVSPGTTGPTSPTGSPTGPGESPAPRTPSEPPQNTAPATPGTEPGGGVRPPPQPATPGAPAT